jgi:hypothetical protein
MTTISPEEAMATLHDFQKTMVDLAQVKGNHKRITWNELTKLQRMHVYDRLTVCLKAGTVNSDFKLVCFSNIIAELNEEK